jgi:hypothetical protein
MLPMKTNFQFIVFIVVTLLITVPGKGQVLNENFNSGIPAGWTQNPAASWTLHPTFGGTSGSCIIAEEIGSNTLTAYMKTSLLNLSSVVNPTVHFKAAITKNNFLHGNIALFFDEGTGPQFVARWGSGFTPNTTYTVPEDGVDYVAPLDAVNIFWHSYSQTISPTNNFVSLIFAAEFVNGGYILFDSIVVAGTTSTLTTGIKETNDPAISIFPNPFVNGKASIRVEHFKEIEFYNQWGQRVPLRIDRKNEILFELDASAISPGIYYLAIKTTDDTAIRKKVIIE